MFACQKEKEMGGGIKEKEIKDSREKNEQCPTCVLFFVFFKSYINGKCGGG